ncbi:MAG TPA: DUF3310 domain-containing protein [Synergistaceae bacterium]|nr:DUF3310 domain-containing protein [Synergistaceae bacterium]
MTARDKCPAHYCFSDLQPWDVIDAWGVDYYLGNVLKYICRAGKKEPERLADLNKALHYLQKEVELAERALAESCAFSRAMEATTDEATEAEKLSWDFEVWPTLFCDQCREEMEGIEYHKESETLEFYCDKCGTHMFVRLAND